MKTGTNKDSRRNGGSTKAFNRREIHGNLMFRDCNEMDPKTIKQPQNVSWGAVRKCVFRNAVGLVLKNSETGLIRPMLFSYILEEIFPFFFKQKVR